MRAFGNLIDLLLNLSRMFAIYVHCTLFAHLHTSVNAIQTTVQATVICKMTALSHTIYYVLGWCLSSSFNRDALLVCPGQIDRARSRPTAPITSEYFN